MPDPAPVLDGPHSPLEPSSRASALDEAPEQTSARSWGGVVHTATTLTLGPWIALGRLAEHTRRAIERRFS
jgi:hypothetical protein